MNARFYHTMNRILKTTVTLVGMITVSFQAQAAEGLKTINNPGGGQIVYGPMEGHPSLSDAMSVMLRNIHGHFGERPQISKFIQARGSSSVATFFTLHAKTEDGRQITGMVIISSPKDSDAAAAVLYDDTSRFAKTAGDLLKKLDQAWQADTAHASPSSGKPAREGAASAAPAKPLHTVTFPDNSGTIGLPEGWNLTAASAGAAHAAGTGGESVHLGVLFQNIYDPRNPKTAGMLRYMAMAHQPAFVCPYGGNLLAAYQSLAEQNHKRLGQPIPTFRLIDSQPTPASPYESAAITAQVEMDEHKGQGPILSILRLGALKLQPGGGWAMAINAVNFPKDRKDADWATLVAIVQSYRQNGAVLMQQSDAIVARIHATAEANTARMNQFHATNDARNAAIDQTRDDQSRYSKAFQNYQLDRSVVQETTSGAHGTFDNRTADFLVKSFPNNFEYVQTPDFLKGKDY